MLVTAFASGANTSLVIGIQGVWLFLMVLTAPLLICPLVQRAARKAQAGSMPTPTEPMPRGSDSSAKTSHT